MTEIRYTMKGNSIQLLKELGNSVLVNGFPVPLLLCYNKFPFHWRTQVSAAYNQESLTTRTLYLSATSQVMGRSPTTSVGAKPNIV